MGALKSRVKCSTLQHIILYDSASYKHLQDSFVSLKLGLVSVRLGATKWGQTTVQGTPYLWLEMVGQKYGLNSIYS